MRTAVRWFYCRKLAWRVVRRPERDRAPTLGATTAFAVFKGGNVKPSIVHVDPNGRPARACMEEAVRVAAKAEA